MNEVIKNKINVFTGYDVEDCSYSPMFSEIGLGIPYDCHGVENLYFHYNRSSRSVFDCVVDLGVKVNEKLSDFCKIVYGDNESQLVFYGENCFEIDKQGFDQLFLLTEESSLTCDTWVEIGDNNTVYYRGYTCNGDDRDPDKKAPFICGIKAVKGTLKYDSSIIAEPDDGKLLLAFSFEGGKCSIDSVNLKLENAPSDISKAYSMAKGWLGMMTENFDVFSEDDSVNSIIAESLKGMIFNLCHARGSLENHLSPFPSRGGYPCTYIWDTYFQNLGYELLEPELCKDFILQIIENGRPDGKFPQFMCSTWARPHETQPALMGFALRNIFGNDIDFDSKVFEALEKNNNWWLTSRMTKFGLISCPHGLETGQDDSPRFDNGPTLATDMNSYLLDQLKVTAKIASVLDMNEESEKWKCEAEKLESNMIKYLYDEEDNLFYDVCLADDKKIKMVSLSSFLPLWAGVELGNGKEKAMIDRYLINPEYMFSDIPFPSVAYNEEKYQEFGWWRGPTWMPTAWLMLELLASYGYENEQKEAAKKLIDMLTKDGKMHEFFNSRTGEGGGCCQQGWTCAIYLRLLHDFC